jgi:phage tail sheath protein FI
MTGQLLWVPPSVAVLGVLASSQASTDVWFAPAGFNRGGLTDGAAGIQVTGVTERLTSKERDTLYDANINPIASFPSSGIVLFGQKTLQEDQSALDRINVRRLVIYLKKQISILSTQVLFEQNVQATWDRFTGLVRPLLEGVQSRFGITDFRLVLDSSTTTDDLIDQNILYAKIMVKPARAIEFIAIDFSIMSTGASFDD